MAFDVVKSQDIELTKFKNTPGAADLYREGKKLLLQSGIINFFRIFARPFSVDRGANVYTSAYSAAFSEGYNKALDDIVYFEEMYLDDKRGQRKVEATFGAIPMAMKSGDLKPSDIKDK